MQFGAKPLFSDVSVKFGGGNRYGLIGANGCGKSTFMKILGGELEPSAGTVAIDSNERVGRLRQDQFAYEDQRVLDVVLQGHAEMWAAMHERDAIYADEKSDEAEFLKAADLEAKYAEYGGNKVYPGNYDDYMEASTLAKQQQQKDNAKAKDRISDLEEFVRRFRAHKAKARQATSRMKQIEKLKVEDVKPSSRQYPFIRFTVDPKEKLHRLAMEVQGLAKGYEKGKNLFEKLDLTIEAGEKVAIIGPNGIGKTTLLRCIVGNLQATAGTVKWAEKANVGYWPQDPADEFKSEDTLNEWMGRWRRKDKEQDDQVVRATLGQLLFSGEDQKKSLKVISGGEGQRMLIGKLVLGMPNVM